MTDYKELLRLINRKIESTPIHGEPADLYDPVNYILSLGGKRLRPVLVLMAHEMFGGNPRTILDEALAIELFHNFTLVHDDIMDQAPLRRNQPTVHIKWDTNTAILAGDLMLVKAYEMLSSRPHEKLFEVMNLFSRTAAEVCEGQQWDMKYESQKKVSHEEYIRMISLKTAVLLGCSLKTGAIFAGAFTDEADLIYSYGKHIGIGFQLMDDILDVFGNRDQIGKQPGGDILANKKTYLLISSLQKAKGSDLDELKHWLGPGEHDPQKKVSAVRSIYERLDVRSEAEAEMYAYFLRADMEMDRIKLPEEKKVPLLELAAQLKVRIN
jgi:geranylgeranyl diphosphate synthase, type II